MKCRFILFMVALSFNCYFGQTKFLQFLKYVDSLPYNQKEIVADSFFAAVSKTGMPIIEDNSIYFIYRGESENVYICGEFNHWKNDTDKMIKIAGTDIQYFKWNIPEDSLDIGLYKINVSHIPNGGLKFLADDYIQSGNYNFKINSSDNSNESFYNIMIDDYSDTYK